MLTPEEQLELQRVRDEFAKCEQKPTYEIFCYEEMLEMDDGVKLRTIIYRPDREGAMPTIVVRTCYPQNDYLYRATAEDSTILTSIAVVPAVLRVSGSRM